MNAKGEAMREVERFDIRGTAIIPEDVELLSDGSRVGRSQRERAVAHLADMCAKEYISDDEYETRAGYASAARTKAELSALVRDLPPPPMTRREVRLNLTSRDRKEVSVPVRRGLHVSSVAAVLLFFGAVVGTQITMEGAHPNALENVMQFMSAFIGVICFILALVMWFNWEDGKNK